MKKYCKKCEQIVEPVLESYNSQFSQNEKVYKYRAYRGYCPECNNLLERIPSQDFESRDKAYRNSEGIITTRQINEILEKYNVNSEIISNALGWDVNKVEEYMLGRTPTLEDSEKLFEILENNNYAMELFK